MRKKSKTPKAATGHAQGETRLPIAGDAVEYIGIDLSVVDGAAPPSPNASEIGQVPVGAHYANADSLAPQKAAADHYPPDTQTHDVGAAASHTDARASVDLSQDPAARAHASVPVASREGLSTAATHSHVAPSLAPIINEIRARHRERVFAMEQRKRSDLALGAYLRRALGWSRALPKSEADQIAKSAKDMITLGERICDRKETGIGDPQWAQFGPIISASIMGRAHWDDVETNATKEMERLAKSLPVWPAFGEPIKGFGARSLAVIVGEAGDLSLYANPAKLWKRMGLAVMNGVRQGGLRKSAGADEWIAHGYNAKRRSFMFVIGDVLVKNQSEYRELYLARKEIERAKAAERGLTVAPAAKIPAKRKEEFMSDGHVHRRAQRYMEKRLLRNLWSVWRSAKTLPSTILPVPSASIPAKAGKRRTKDKL